MKNTIEELLYLVAWFGVIFAILFLSSPLNAATFEPKLTRKTVDIDFRQITIPELLNAVLKDMLHHNFILSPELVTDTRKVTVQLKNIPTSDLLPVFSEQASGLGLEIKQKSGVFLVTKKSIDSVGQFIEPLQSSVSLTQNESLVTNLKNEKLEPDKPINYKYYTPKYRSISYLAKMAKFSGVNVIDIDDASPVLGISSHDDKKLTQAFEILENFDKPPQGVTIKAAIIEYSNSSESARSLSGLLTLLAGKIGIVYAAGQTLPNSLTFKDKNLSTVLSAIDGDSNFKYIAEPTLRVLNGEKAKLTVGSDVPVRGQTVIDKNGNPVQSIDYKTAGVQFEILPKIQGETVLLQVSQSISNFSNNTTSNIDSPTLFKRASETTIDTQKGSLTMLAGLDENKTSKTTSGLFFLPKFMHSKNNTVSQSQIILLIEVLKDSTI